MNSKRSKKLFLPKIALISMIFAALQSITPTLSAQNDQNDQNDTIDDQIPNTTQTLRPPTLIEAAEVVYPSDAWDDEVQADVIIELDLDETGAVLGATANGMMIYTYDDEGYVVETLLETLPDQWGFAQAAEEAALNYQFEPAQALTDEGWIAVPVRMAWQIGFVITYDEAILNDSTEEESLQDEVIEEQVPGRETRPVEIGTFAQLEGTLLERGTRTPMNAIAVTITSEEGISQTVFTDEQGQFFLGELAPGQWNISVTEAGYHTVDLSETLNASEAVQVRYFIERENYSMYTSRTTTTPVRREVTRRDVSLAEIQRIPGTSNDALRVVLNMPGVSRSAFDGGEIVMRGSNSSDNAYLLDGMPIPLLYHFGGLRSIVPSELLGELQVTPGGFGAAYGNATGGIVNARTGNAPESTHGHFDINVMDTSVFIQGPISERLSLQLGARRSYIDGVLAIANDLTEGINMTQAPRYYDAQARLIWEINEKNTFSTLFFLSDDAFALVSDDESDIPPEQRGGFDLTLHFQGIQTHLNSILGPQTSNALSFQLLTVEQRLAVGDNMRINMDAISLFMRDEITWNSQNEQLTLQFGVDGSIRQSDWDVAAPRIQGEGEVQEDLGETEVLITSAIVNVNDVAVYTSATWTPTESLSLTPGIRAEYFSLHDEIAFDPRITMRGMVSSTLTLKGAVGRYHRSLGASELDENFGNPNQVTESAIHYIIGSEYQFLPSVRFDTELFYKDLIDLSVASDAMIERDGVTVREMLNNDGQGRAYGAEFFLRHQPANNFFGWISYGISRSERQDPGSSQWRAFDYDQTHVFTALGSYELQRGWSIGARYRFVTGNPMTPILGGTFDSDRNTYIPALGGTNAERMPDFHQFDLRIDKRWIFNTWTMNAYLDIQNATNRQHVEGFIHNYDYTETDELNGLPIIPSIGLRGEF